MATNPVNPAEIDWPRVSGIVERCASAWCRHANLPDVFDGVGAQDVVAETWVAYFQSPTQLGWNPHEAPLEVFLWGVCRHKLITHLRRNKHIVASLDDETSGFHAELTSQEPSQHEQLQAEDSARKFARELFERIGKINRKPEEMRAVVSAAMSIEEPDNVNQQLAARTNFPVSKIEVIKKRLRRLKFDWRNT